MKILVDTNVLLSAALRDRLPEQVVLYVAQDSTCRWIVMAEILREYVEVLRRPKFGFSSDVLARWTELITLRTILVATQNMEIEFPRDPKDVPFLAAAISADANVLITGDGALLQLNGTLPTRIVTAAQFAAEHGIVPTPPQ